MRWMRERTSISGLMPVERMADILVERFSLESLSTASIPFLAGRES